MRTISLSSSTTRQPISLLRATPAFWVATMVIFLSIGLVAKVQEALLAGGAYTADTPAAVVYKATWPEQRVVRCTVGSLAESTKAAGITKTALIVVGDFLGTRYERSKLYDPAFATEYRPATEPKQ